MWRFYRLVGYVAEKTSLGRVWTVYDGSKHGKTQNIYLSNYLGVTTVISHLDHSSKGRRYLQTV